MRRFLIILLCLSLFVIPAGAEDATDTEIIDMNTEIQLQEDGSCTVNSSFTVRFSGKDSSFVIPLGVDAVDYSLGIPADVQKINNVTCYVLPENGASFAGQQNFSVTYTLPCQVSTVDGKQHLDLSVLASGFTCPINAWKFTVHFPAAFETMPDLFSGYHGNTAFNDFDIQCADGVYTANMLTRMQDHDSLRLQMDLPDGYFDLRNLPGKTEHIDRNVFLGVALLCLLYWFFRLRNPLKLPKKCKLPPVHVTAGELSYHLTCDKPDLASLVMQWADLGYLTVRRHRNGRVVLTRRMEMGNERRSVEVKLFSTLFRKDGNCDVQSLRYRNAAKKMCHPFGIHCARRMFSRHKGSVRLYRMLGMIAAYASGFMAFDLLLGAYDSRWVLIALLSVLVCVLSWLIQQGIICLLRRRRKRPLILAGISVLALVILMGISGSGVNMILNILLQAFIGITAMFGGKRSSGGWDILLHLLGFRSYLRHISVGELRQQLQSDPMFFYRMYPYAEAAGFGKRYAKRFASVPLEPCDWLKDAKDTATKAGDFCQIYASVIATMRQEDVPNVLVAMISGAVDRRKRIRARKAGKYTAARKKSPSSAKPKPQPAYLRPHRRVTEEYPPEEYDWDNYDIT